MSVNNSGKINEINMQDNSAPQIPCGNVIDIDHHIKNINQPQVDLVTDTKASDNLSPNLEEKAKISENSIHETLNLDIITGSESNIENSEDQEVLPHNKDITAENRTESNTFQSDMIVTLKNSVNSEETLDQVASVNETNSNTLETESTNMIECDNMARCSKHLEVQSENTSPEALVEKVKTLDIVGEEKSSRETNSNVVVNRQTESLKSLMTYDGSSDSENSETETKAEIVDSAANNPDVKKVWRKHLDSSSNTDSESDSTASTLSSDSESNIDDSDDDSASVIVNNDNIRKEPPTNVNKEKEKGAVKRKNPNILDMEEFLPPIPDLSQLNINVDEADFMHIGRISAIISELVTIEAIPGTPAFDLDSMLFMDDQNGKKPIGPIFDVLGPVAEPIYCVRFNNEKEVSDLGLKSGMKVYAVPKNDEFTKFVFVQELMKIKGSDASWLNDQETPSDIAEFSDDEKEREARRSKKTSVKRKLEDGSLERHKRYERTMNQCNTLNTRVCRLMDAHKNISKHIRPNDNSVDVKPPTAWPEPPPVPVQFDPTVPPPGFGQTTTYRQASPFGSPSFGQSAHFNSSLWPYNPSQSPGQNYGNEPLFSRWSWNSQNEAFRRPHRSNNQRSNQQNSDSYFTNNGRNNRGAGPSSETF